MDSLFSPNASSVASPMPQTQTAPQIGAGETKVTEEHYGEGTTSTDHANDIPAMRTRQNLCLKDKPLEVHPFEFASVWCVCVCICTCICVFLFV